MKKLQVFSNKQITRFPIGCRGGIRTPDLQVMSLTSYRTAPPCNLVMKGEPVKSRKSKMQPFFNLECIIFRFRSPWPVVEAALLARCAQAGTLDERRTTF